MGKTIESLEYRRIHQQFNKVPDSIREKIKFLKSEGQHRSLSTYFRDIAFNFK
jgi:hypothetical protein